ncbi:hypothetical protein DAY19_12365 [Halobacteriovorax vibrionivorans]|uniref:Uncharacterized protein n=1 Tax=Halobacteriovorax vibrionivorans TaxID=2152716 RepID=A0ABY0ICT7_9BACT|nr:MULTISPECIES: hypothetical protein [Halobacteriovorax]RZF20773.1 hypothetical protein DAY19_12365 [Halobacteriovorax vibrionivorans]TGD46501.1 hypothetical protein EP118_11805 [Halobacteriovorax sp. Y22]
MNLFKAAILFIVLVSMSYKTFASTGLVAIKGESLPAADLYSPKYGAIDSEQAFELQQEGVDLSKLSPVLSSLWNGHNNFADHERDDKELPIYKGHELDFKGTISSPASILRFNASNNEGNFQVHLSKSLHTILLRKHFLRRLGYIIPASKYLEEVRINFKNERQKDFFKDVDLVTQLGASYKNWLVEEGTNYLVLKDIFVRMPQESDFYDVALTSLNDSKDLRSLRSLIVIYSYLNLNESINKFSYNFLKIKNEHLVFDYPTTSDFDATYDDVLWMARLVAELDREDITALVKASHYPAIVEKILIEKLIARRNNLVEVLKLQAKQYDFKKEIKHELVKDGHLKPHKFEGYAGQFSFGASQGPLDHLPSFLFGEAQSAAFSGIMGKVSENLKLFNISDAKIKWLQEDFEGNKEFALDYFEEHGQFPPLPFSSWKSPVVSGNILFGRDVVVGQNFGTDNFVQLADTIGFTTNLGLFIGLERFISQTTSGSLFPNIGIHTSYTHVRPVEDLKQAIKTPYKNMLVGKTLKVLQKNLTQYLSASNDEEDKKEKLFDIYRSISENFGVGESIIISTSVVPDITLSINAPLFDVANGYGSVSKKYKELSRIHITRKSKYNFHIYYDDARVNELRVRGGLSYLIPIVMFEGKKIDSKLDMKLYQINLDPDQDELDFSKNVAKFISLLRDRTNDAMGEEDIQVYNNSNDSLFNFNFLFLVKKSLNTFSEILVKIKNRLDIKLVSASHGELDGVNYSKFLRNMGGYLLKRYISEIGSSFDVDDLPFLSEAKHYYKNPGKNLFGAATTHETTLESKLIDDEGKVEISNMKELYMSYRKTYERAVIKEKVVRKKLKKENEDFNLKLYTKSDASDAGDMHFARLETKIHFFDGAVKRILNISDRELDELSNKMIIRNCHQRHRRHDRNTSGQTRSQRLRCGDLDVISNKLYWCRKYLRKDKAQKGLKCLSHVGHYFARYIDARTLLDFFGERNLYVESKLSGYRVDHELMLAPIEGNSYGKINTRSFGGPIGKLISVLNLIKAEVKGLWYREDLN